MWTFIAMAPDGRELARETGGSDAEARVRAVADRFNQHLPWHAKSLATVRVVPASVGAAPPIGHPTGGSHGNEELP